MNTNNNPRPPYDDDYAVDGVSYETCDDCEQLRGKILPLGACDC